MPEVSSRGWVGDWSPGIGDPTFVGWLTVIAYFVACWFCIAAFKAQKRTPDTRQGPGAYIDAAASCFRAFRWFRRPIAEVPLPARIAMLWMILAATFFLLGINKQLDLQSLFTEVGRALAWQQGWYEQRRTVQRLFILLVAVLGFFGLRGVLRLASGRLRELKLALGGTCFVLTFVVIRAASFHHFDLLIDFEALGVRMNWVLELSGIACVGLAARREVRSSNAGRVVSPSSH